VRGGGQGGCRGAAGEEKWCLLFVLVLTFCINGKVGMELFIFFYCWWANFFFFFS